LTTTLSGAGVAPPASAPTAAGRPRWVALAIAPVVRQIVIQRSVPAESPRLRDCPMCGAPVVAGAASTRPGGRCTCGNRLGPPPGTIEVALLATCILAVVVTRDPWEAPAYLWWATCWVALTFIDLSVHRLPQLLSFAAAGGLLVLLIPAALVHHDGAALARAAEAGLAVAALFAGGAVFGGSGLGAGDVKAGLAVGAAAGWFSWFAVVASLIATSVLAALFSAALLMSRRAGRHTRIAMGPWLFLGVLVALGTIRALS
jgi:leader peptidase (prepilin peptidase) / N-methyltransferase